jgi:hypothetical protein
MDDLFHAVSTSGKILLSVNILLLIIVNVKSIARHPKHVSRSMILLMLLLIGTLYIEIFSSYLASQHIPNLHLTHYYTIGQFFILSMIYYRQLKKFQLVVPIGVVLFSGILIYQLIESKIVYNEFNTSGFLVSACVLISFAFFYYLEHITEKRYWDTFNVGLFLYLGGSSIIFLTMNRWKDLEDWYLFIWTINGSLVVLYQVFITLTIYRFHRIQKNQNGISPL